MIKKALQREGGDATYEVVFALHGEFEIRVTVLLPQEPGRIGNGNEPIADAVECHRFDGLFVHGAIHIGCLRSSADELDSTAMEGEGIWKGDERGRKDLDRARKAECHCSHRRDIEPHHILCSDFGFPRIKNTLCHQISRVDLWHSKSTGKRLKGMTSTTHIKGISVSES
jgi:hypothetical protein